MTAFVTEYGLENMVTVVDDDGELWARFGVRVQPAWAFISPDGSVEVAFGALGPEAIAAQLTALEEQS